MKVYFEEKPILSVRSALQQHSFIMSAEAFTDIRDDIHAA
jgi:hypothetical protein